MRCMVRLMVDFLFLLRWSWSARGQGTGREIAIFLQFLNLQPNPVLSTLDVLHSVIVVDERGGWIRPIEHSLPCTRMAIVSLPGAVVAVGRGPTPVSSLLLLRNTHFRHFLSCDVILPPDLWTSIKEVPLHPAAVTLFMPVRSLAAGVIEVSRQATVAAVPIGTLTDQVSWGATEEAGLFFGLRAVLGEMSILVAVSTLDTLGGVVSV